LGDDGIDKMRFYRVSEENNSVFQEAGINVIYSFSIFGFFNDSRNEDHERVKLKDKRGKIKFQSLKFKED
jgi:hypothetical protein